MQGIRLLCPVLTAFNAGKNQDASARQAYVTTSLSTIRSWKCLLKAFFAVVFWGLRAVVLVGVTQDRRRCSDLSSGVHADASA
mmetsp:Transcript_76919/g.152274  ORF Transcript_76919/g.152274 Transcript_76919/m.152274 type:complete len:83 (-) Transcript_76919:1497-1745(-)